MSIENTYSRNSDYTANKIKAFREVSMGWHYGSGSPPSHTTIDNALKLNFEAQAIGFPKTNAFLGIDGEVQVAAYLGQLYLEITVEPNDKITLVIENGDNELAYEENLSMQEAFAQMRKLRGLIWALSGLSTNTIMIAIKNVSTVLPSSLPVTAAAYPSSMRIAYYKSAQASASILRDTIKVNPAPLLYFGKYLPSPSLISASSFNKQAQAEMFATTTS